MILFLQLKLMLVKVSVVDEVAVVTVSSSLLLLKRHIGCRVETRLYTLIAT